MKGGKDSGAVKDGGAGAVKDSGEHCEGCCEGREG